MSLDKEIGNKIMWTENINSTNEYIKSSKDLMINGDIVIARFQSNGKGQEGNVWESQSGMNLLFSIFLNKINCKAEDQFMISKAISLGICDYLNNRIKGFTIKWPNDIYFDNKKIAGILIENSIQINEIASSIIGIGININQIEFSKSIPNPVSLKMITGENYNIEIELNHLIDSLNLKVSLLLDGNFEILNEEYYDFLFRYDEPADFVSAGIRFSGIISGVDKFGRLLINDEKGNQRIFGFKEVEYDLL